MYDKLRGAKVISTLDMKNGFFAAGLHPDSQYLTSFASPWGTFSYQVLSQGLISSAAHFQNWVESKLRKHGILLEFAPFEGDGADEEGCGKRDDSESSRSETDQVRGGRMGNADRGERAGRLQTGNGFVCNYCDDLVVVSNSVEEHKEHLKKLFEILSEEKIYLNAGKSVLFAKYVRYLGCVCGQDHLLIDPEKVRAIIKMPEPKKDQTAVRGFLGMCSFWRRWIPGYHP